VVHPNEAVVRAYRHANEKERRRLRRLGRTRCPKRSARRVAAIIGVLRDLPRVGLWKFSPGPDLALAEVPHVAFRGGVGALEAG
jgi:hypothetical protein